MAYEQTAFLKLELGSDEQMNRNLWRLDKIFSGLATPGGGTSIGFRGTSSETTNRNLARLDAALCLAGLAATFPPTSKANPDRTGVVGLWMTRGMHYNWERLDAALASLGVTAMAPMPQDMVGGALAMEALEAEQAEASRDS